MSLKQEIMEKLFAEQPLTNKEILYIGASLNEDGPDLKVKKTRKSKNELLPYDHKHKQSLAKACSLCDSDFNHVNELIRSEVMDRKDELDCDSKQVEIYERIGLAKPINFRVLMYQFIKMKVALQKRDSSGGIGIRFGGGDGRDFGDFLDFLRKGGR